MTLVTRDNQWQDCKLASSYINNFLAQKPHISKPLAVQPWACSTMEGRGISSLSSTWHSSIPFAPRCSWSPWKRYEDKKRPVMLPSWRKTPVVSGCHIPGANLCLSPCLMVSRGLSWCSSLTSTLGPYKRSRVWVSIWCLLSCADQVCGRTFNCVQDCEKHVFDCCPILLALARCSKEV